MKLFTNMPIGRRLALGFGTAVTFVVLVSLLGAWNFHSLSQANQEMMASPLVKERLINDWYRNISNDVTRTMAVAQSADSSLVQIFAVEAQAATEESTALQQKIEPMLVADYEFEIFRRVVQHRDLYEDARNRITAAEQSGNDYEARVIFNNDLAPAAHQYQSAVNELLISQQVYMDRVAAGFVETSQQSQILLIGSSLLVAVLCAFFSWRLTRGITLPLAQAVEAAQRIAKGDLTGNINASSTDETGVALATLADRNNNRNKLVGSVRNGAESIASASSQIAAGNTDLSSRTEEQAASLTETASAMEELTNTIRQT